MKTDPNPLLQAMKATAQEMPKVNELNHEGMHLVLCQTILSVTEMKVGHQDRWLRPTEAPVS